MSSTTNDAEQSSKSGGPKGCVDRSRPVASSLPLRHLSLRHSSLHLNHGRHNGDMEVLGPLPVLGRIRFAAVSEQKGDPNTISVNSDRLFRDMTWVR